MEWTGGPNVDQERTLDACATAPAVQEGFLREGREPRTVEHHGTFKSPSMVGINQSRSGPHPRFRRPPSRTGRPA